MSALADRATFVPRFKAVDTLQWELRVFSEAETLQVFQVDTLDPLAWKSWAVRMLGSMGLTGGSWVHLRSGGWEAIVAARHA